MFGGASFRVNQGPTWDVATFCLTWAAIIAYCLLVWLKAISLVM